MPSQALESERVRIRREPTLRPARPYQHRRGRQVATARSTVSTAYGLPREQEYGFIRADLRRLLLTAAVLAIMMVGLLLVLQP